MQVYLAGRTTDLERIRRVADIITDNGHEITFEWWGPDGEIRTQVEIDRGDLEVVEHPWEWEQPIKTTITHLPTGVEATAEGASTVQSHDATMRLLRQKIAGQFSWQADPDRAEKLAMREWQAVFDADVVVLAWEENILGAAIEFGFGSGDEKRCYVLKNEDGDLRDSVFWFLPWVKIVENEEELSHELAAIWSEEM